MWIFANGVGFLSIVEDDDDVDQLCVRARNEEHLKSAFPTYENNIVETSEGDYRWRISVERSVVIDLLVELAQDIVYKTNVKGTVAGDDKALSTAMMSCWSAMCRYQDVVEMAGRVDPESFFEGDNDEGEYDDAPEDDGRVVARVKTKRADELSTAMSDAVASIDDDFADDVNPADLQVP